MATHPQSSERGMTSLEWWTERQEESLDVLVEMMKQVVWMEDLAAQEERVLRQETDQALREAMDYKTALT